MKTLSAAALATILVCSSAVMAAEGPPRGIVVKLAPVSEVEQACIDQLKYNWAQPGAYDDSFKDIVLENVTHRKDGQANVIVFEGHAYNSFMQADRYVQVTCRPGEKTPYPVTFQIDR
ncbi:MAG: hypothetical protein K2P94_13305 [Rhodospirillaceae bacterium]|nr:hypothetical protein [Rhodospirillaceae bacterium]